MPASTRSRPPGLDEERVLWAQGHEFVVGVDEVGRGSWAGPLTIGAVILPKDRRINKVRDSKQLTPKQREQLFDRITDWAVAWSIGHATAEECDQLGMSAAQIMAASRAIAALDVEPTAALVDGKWDFLRRPNTKMLVRGDGRSLSIAAASVLAKVTRDRIMRQEAEHFPAYAFDSNKGYPCPRHQHALHGYGPTSIHRRTWVFMDDLAWRGVVRRPGFQEQEKLFQ